MNRYFILPFPNVNSAIWDIVVEVPSSVRTNKIGNKCIIKLHAGDNATHQMMNGFQEYTHQGIIDYLKTNSNEWSKAKV